MRLKGIFNRDGGTFKTTDMDAFSDLAANIFRDAGHDFECAVVSGGEIADVITRTVKAEGFDGMIVGGGDGSISLAAGSMYGTDKLLGVIPAGTMNLFARSLGLPLDIEEALKTLAGGKPAHVDVPTMNGRPFIHQFSAGLHATMIRNREQLDYDSRFGKISASTRAWIDTLRAIPEISLGYECAEASGEGKFALVGVANNRIHGNASLFTDRPQGGKLAFYLLKAEEFDSVLGFALDYFSGRIEDSENTTVIETEKLTLDFHSKGIDQSLDGDPIEEVRHAVLEQHPRSLPVIVPADSRLE
ncbi:diacylglycerol/lipid kinase family protein [Martelella radicis]|uniref:Diacylglycerol kinase family enzyme n=1 Tax=Martelella radicis TaxID=1397476 RepID=A0A7W6KI92_9HYPH|nr:diacylglycerol kinase family protein [Martelella radicis]MBB4121622.1 diacylglycerol kinase family enzyme [Martelella radicis]